MRSRHFLLAAVVALVGSVALGANDPPDGPVRPTPGRAASALQIHNLTTPGDADAHFVLDQPGSYRLDSDIDATDGRVALKITAPNVTVYLNGYTLTGNGTTAGILVAVPDHGRGSTTTIENGVVTGFVNGISVVGLPNNRATGVVLDGVKSIDNTGIGVNFSPLSSPRPTLRIYNSTMSGNGGDGVFSPFNPISVQGSFAEENDGAGIVAGGPDSFVGGKTMARDNKSDGVVIRSGTVEDTDAVANGGNGINASGATDMVRVRNSRANHNAQNGILGGGQSKTMVSNSTAAANGDAGIDAALPDGCQTPQNRIGVRAKGNGARVRTTRAEGNTDAGFDLGPGAVVEGCDAISNGLGILCGSGSAIYQSTASFNLGDGIKSSGALKVDDSVASFNSGNGIVMTAGQVFRSIASTNGLTGIVGGDFVQVVNTTANGNGIHGFSLGQFAHVEASSGGNNLSGAQIAGGSRICDNRFANNSTTALTVTGPSRVWGNTVVNNAEGITITASGSGSLLAQNYIKFHPVGAGIKLLGNNIGVFSNYFRDNSTNITDFGTDNKIGEIQCDPDTCRPYVNWRMGGF